MGSAALMCLQRAGCASHRDAAGVNARCISRRTDKIPAMIPALLLILSAIAYRIVTGLFAQSGSIGLLNFAPLAAIALCAAAYFPAKYKFTVPMIALLISDVVLNIHYGFSLLSPFVLSHYLGFALVGCLGLLLQNRRSLKTLLPASIAGSLIFYIVTNLGSWLFDPGYVKNFTGLVQALTVG
jgi:glucan phosphoethanolaminetransferase (alkaline phosphatase superfamily)